MFKKTRDEAEEHLKRCEQLFSQDPGKYDNAYRNLKSYIDDLDELQREKEAKKSFALEQIPQQAQLAKERAEAMKRLRDKYQIRVNTKQELHFKQLIQMRSQDPKFFYEFKKKRALMTKEKEPEKPELYHVVFLREREQQRLKKEKEK